MQFAQHGPRAMCVLSANGAISNVTLRQQSSSGGTVTYEVCFQIYASQLEEPKPLMAETTAKFVRLVDFFH